MTDLGILKAYLAPWSNQNAPATTPPHLTRPSAGTADLASVPPEPGGFAFDPSFEGWKLISATDRGDNNSVRFILGNSIAISAARSGNISPWPAGARFAKIAWQKHAGPDVPLNPPAGQFIRVEIMDKDASRSTSRPTAGDGHGGAA